VPRGNAKLRVVARAGEAQPAKPKLDAAAEAQLVQGSRGGDMHAWAQLYETHFHGLFRHLCYLTSDPVLSEDLAQETFARALGGLARYGERARFSTWLHGIAINVVRKARERRRKADATQARLEVESSAIPQSSELERRHLQKRRAAVLARILEQLPDHLREAFVLRDLKGESVPEAALQLGVTEANLRVRACRARARVHDLLVAEGWIGAPQEKSE